MPSSDFQTLYQFEDAIESAVKTLFTNNSITAYRQRDNNTRVTPAVDIQFSTGAATEHLGYTCDGKLRPDTWNGSLQIRIVTTRSKNDASHSTLRGKIRNLLYSFEDNLTRTLLPHHSIARVMETGTTPQIEADEDHDISSISFNLVFAIRPDAWPVAT